MSDPHGHQASSPWQMPGRAWKDIASRTWQRTWDDNVGLVAAGVAFYLFFALLSAFGVIVLVYGFLADPQTVVDNVRALTAILPADVAALVGEQLMYAVQTSQGAKGIGILAAFGVALYGGTNGAAAILTALNIAYEEKEKRTLLRFYLISMAMALVAIALALVAIAANATIAYLQTQLPGASRAAGIAGSVLGYVAMSLIAAAIAATLYRFGPSREEARWKWITPGSVFAAVTWLLLSGAFAFYLAELGDYSATYGSLGAAVALLTWLYLAAYAFMFGAELNSELEHQTATDSTTGEPLPMGERGAWAADNVAEDDHVQDRPEEQREGEKLTGGAPQVAEEKKG